jgi:peptidoglycan/xylan/chitin deacetylase (PgdA/CDA1 family)
MKRWLYRGLHVAGLTAFARTVRNAGVVLCYHNIVAGTDIRDGGAPGMHMSLDQFTTQMRWLAMHYEVLPLPALLDRLARGESMRRTASVTFDDAYAGVFQLGWPVLRELGITPTVFVVAGAPAGDRPFWWDHPAVQHLIEHRREQEWLTALRGDGEAILQSLPGVSNGEPAASAAYLPAPWHVIAQAASDGVDIGVHSATHRALPTLNDRELGEEVEGSRAVIAREIGVVPTCFAFPYGLWDRRVRDRVAQAGYRAALTLDYGLVGTRADARALPRVNVPAGMSDPAYRAWTAGLNLRHMLWR